MKSFVAELKRLAELREIEKLHTLIAEKVCQESENSEWLLRLAIVLLDRPFSDEITSLELVENVLDREPRNFNAFVIWAYIQHYWFSINEQFLKRVSFIQAENDAERAIVAFLTAWFYASTEDTENERYWLLESIKFCDKYVWSHWRLTQLYMRADRLKDAREHLQKALNNIAKIYPDNHDEDGDIKEFIGANITGINQEQPTVKSFQQKLEEISKI